MELAEGRPFFFTFFHAPDVTLHATKAEGLEDFLRAHTGSLLKPPFEAARLEAIGELVEHLIPVDGAGWKEASCDIVLSGLGWFSITGAGPCTVRVRAPRGTMVVQRDPLMPFEAKATMGKATGGRIVKKPRKKKTGDRR